jgi:hypothetical protein
MVNSREPRRRKSGLRSSAIENNKAEGRRSLSLSLLEKFFRTVEAQVQGTPGRRLRASRREVSSA